MTAHDLKADICRGHRPDDYADLRIEARDAGVQLLAGFGHDRRRCRKTQVGRHVHKVPVGQVQYRDEGGHAGTVEVWRDDDRRIRRSAVAGEDLGYRHRSTWLITTATWAERMVGDGIVRSLSRSRRHSPRWEPSLSCSKFLYDPFQVELADLHKQSCPVRLDVIEIEEARAIARKNLFMQPLFPIEQWQAAKVFTNEPKHDEGDQRVRARERHDSARQSALESWPHVDV